MSSTPRKRSHPPSGAFSTSEPIWREAADLVQASRLGDTTLHDLKALRLLLRGESVIDWHRLDIRDRTQLRRIYRLNGINLDHPADHQRLEDLRDKSLDFIRSTLRLRVPESLIHETSVEDLPLVASEDGSRQQQACLLLKVMHVIHHLEARELRTWLPVSDTDLYVMVEQSVLRTFDELRNAGLPTVEFAWSRKQQNSLITKLLLKRESLAAQVFDRLRFRLIVREPEDVEPTLQLILRQCIPFNFIVPGQTVNTLVDEAPISQRIAALRREDSGDESGDGESSQPSTPNEYSSSSYHHLNFGADLPVQVDDLLVEQGIDPKERGRVVFVLAEFQVCDQATALANEEGPSAHELYKSRQLAGARERLLRRPSTPKSTNKPTANDSNS